MSDRLLSDTEISPIKSSEDTPDEETDRLKTFEDYNANPSNLKRKNFPKIIKSSR